MQRSKKIIYTCHCVLNQNSVIRDWERSTGAFNRIVKIILDSNISIIQLPCPEFIFSGEDRPPKTKEEYDTSDYRKLCDNIAKNVVKEMNEYIQHDYNIIGILGISNSPSCDTLDGKGIFMEELFKIMGENNINLKTFDIPEDYIEGKNKKTAEKFYKFISDK